jgi:hypothetical protein
MQDQKGPTLNLTVHWNEDGGPSEAPKKKKKGANGNAQVLLSRHVTGSFAPRGSVIPGAR